MESKAHMRETILTYLQERVQTWVTSFPLLCSFSNLDLYLGMKWSESRSVVSNSLLPHGLYSPWNPPGNNTGVGSLSLLQRTFPTQESNPDLSKWQADSLPAEPRRKPKNIGVGSLSLLQQIFPTQESNWDLLHCRQILYQLSYQGSSKPITKDRQ